MSKKYQLIQSGAWQIFEGDKPFLVLQDKTKMVNIEKTLAVLNADAAMRERNARAGRVKNPNKGKGGGRPPKNAPTCYGCGKKIYGARLVGSSETKSGKLCGECTAKRADRRKNVDDD